MTIKQLFILLIAIFYSGLGASRPLDFVEYSYVEKFFDKNRPTITAVREAFRREGRPFVIRYEPGSRVLHDLLAGNADGTLYQLDALSNFDTNVVKIDFPIASIPIFLAASHPDTFENTPICQARVGIINGQDWILKELLKQKGCTAKGIRTNVRMVQVLPLIKMLRVNRIDYALMPGSIIDQFNRSSDYQLSYNGAHAYQAEFYIHLHERHKQWASSLTQHLKDVFLEMGLSIDDHNTAQRGSRASVR